METWFLHDKDGQVVEERLFEGGAVRNTVTAGLLASAGGALRRMALRRPC
ncbi:MAG: hypothetical protein IMW99_04720 [Firmicutes bacterium]|nr:hypothetical protein [Bacillota bacterium]